MLFRIAAIGACFLTSHAFPRAAGDPTVTIASGVLVGTATSVSNQPSNTGLVHAFLGVPFASNPPKRFEPPTPPVPWTSPLRVTSQKPQCLQQFFPGDLGAREKQAFNNPFDHPPPVEDESCLYLSVYEPRDACPDKLKPVLVWIFGGDLMFGGSAVNAYNGSSFALNQDVVVVVPNYRTNIFGFSNSPEVPINSQNSGFLDQRFALQWVQQNIKAFGGDPARVTLFGESAGGYSIKQLLAQPPSPLPFAAAILESPALASLPTSRLNWDNVVNHFGCAAQASPLQCMQTKPATDIQSYISNNYLTFFPVIDNTNVGYNTDVQIRNGQFAKVPIMMGTNLNEFRVFEYILGINNSTAVADGVVGLVSTGFGQSTSAFVNELKTTIGLFSLLNLNPTGNFDAIDRIATDLIFTCPVWSISSLLTQYGYKVWRYQYDAVFPELSFFPDAGAYHTSEITTVWGTYPLSNAYGKATPNQIALSSYMQTTWANFAKNPSQGPAWPSFGQNGNVDLGVLGGSSNPSGESTQSSAGINTKCQVYYKPLLTLLDYQY